MGKIREAELMCAAQALGVNEVVFLDYIDGELDQADPAEAMGKIAYHLRHVRPQVVVTFDPFGAYGHPDHIAISQYTLGAVVMAADASFADAAELAPHRVAKVYFMLDTQSLVDMYAELVGERITFEVDGAARMHTGWPAWAGTAHIDATAHWETNLKAIACHQTQVKELMAKIYQIPERYGIETWAVQQYYRVYSLVNGGRKVETDLFEGLR
jgi:LmbE family N-acetylglucosaminyl deacetylase